MTTKKHTLNELKELIAANLDITEILDVLGWDIPELLDVIEEHVSEAHEEFEDAVE